MLEWKCLDPDFAFVAPAPLFGNIRVERYSVDSGWRVNYSVPGFSSTLIHGEWPESDMARSSAEKLVAAAFEKLRKEDA